MVIAKCALMLALSTAHVHVQSTDYPYAIISSHGSINCVEPAKAEASAAMNGVVRLPSPVLVLVRK
jgi:hypothetical protein